MGTRILITGGGGQVASLIRPHLAAPGRTIVLVDLAPVSDLGRGEEYYAASVTDIEAMTKLSRDADLVIHLAGFSQERPWPEILETNINGTYVVLEAARAAGVTKLLLASSIHAVGFATAAEAGQTTELHPRPDTLYGVGKVALEALGRLYADRFSMTVVAARIGTVEVEPGGTRSLSTWAAPADLARLAESVLKTAEPGGHVIWGVSANTRGWADLGANDAIGYQPQEDAEQFAASISGESCDPATTLLGDAFTERPLGQAW